MKISWQSLCGLAGVVMLCLPVAGCGRPEGQPTDVSQTPPKAPAPNVPSAPKQEPANARDREAQSPFSFTVDLLAKCNVETNLVQGRATMSDGKLLLQSSEQFSQVMIPYFPSTGYELETVVERRGGQDSLTLGIFIAGRLCALQIDAYPEAGGYTALDLVDQQRPPDRQFAAYKQAGLLLREGVPTTVLCRVAGDRIGVVVGNRFILDCRIEPHRLSFPPELMVRDPRAMCISACRSHFLVSKIELRELGGRLPPPLKELFGPSAAPVPEQMAPNQGIHEGVVPPRMSHPSPDTEPDTSPTGSRREDSPTYSTRSPWRGDPADITVPTAYRVWTLKDGRTQELKFLGLTDDKKRGLFGRRDKTVIAVAVEHLSEADQELLVPR